MPTVRLSDCEDPDRYLFDFRVGDPVRHQKHAALAGRIVEGWYEGVDDPSRGSSYSVRYEVEQKNGVSFRANQTDLERDYPTN